MFLFLFIITKNQKERWKIIIKKKYSLHTATLTFLFKEMSFPNVLDLDPLEEDDD